MQRLIQLADDVAGASSAWVVIFGIPLGAALIYLEIKAICGETGLTENTRLVVSFVCIALSFVLALIDILSRTRVALIAVVATSLSLLALVLVAPETFVALDGDGWSFGTLAFGVLMMIVSFVLFLRWRDLR